MKTELIEAALDEFSNKSYGNASLNTILKNTGISKGTFYYHFQDKQALYIFLHESAYQAQIEFTKNHTEKIGEDHDEKNIFELIRLNANLSIQFAVKYPKYMKLTMMFMKEEENKENKIIIDRVNNVREKTLENGIENLVTAAIERGDFNNKFSKDFIIKTINYLFIHYAEIYGLDEKDDMQNFLDDINKFVDFLKNGLGK